MFICCWVLKSKKFKSGEVLWVVHTGVLRRQFLLGAGGSRAILSVCDEKGIPLLNKGVSEVVTCSKYIS